MTTTEAGARQTFQDYFVDGSSTFQGMPVQQTTTEFSSSGSDVSATSLGYGTVDTAQMRIFDFGNDSTDSLGGSTLVTYDPFLLFRYDLEPGESYSQTVTVEATTAQGGIEFPATLSELELTVTYVGVQQITVPAGTFNACRFEHSSITRSAGIEFESSQTLWLAENAGVLLRDRYEGGETVLVEGILNGTAL